MYIIVLPSLCCEGHEDIPRSSFLVLFLPFLVLWDPPSAAVRLWSLQLFTTLVVFKAHIYPVWSVDFSPLGFYFASSSHDRTACIWSTEQAHPVRVLAGHTADVDVS